MDQPLDSIRSAIALAVAPELRQPDTSAAPTGAGEGLAVEGPRVGEVRVRILGVRDERVAPTEVAAHIEYRVAGVLGEENAETGPERPVRGWTVGDAQARREIVVIGIDQATAHKPIAGLGEL